MGGINPGTVDATGDIATESKQDEIASLTRDLIAELKILNKQLSLMTDVEVEEHEI